MKIGIIETCSKSESTNAVINVKIRKIYRVTCATDSFFFDFFDFGGTIADLSLVTTAFLILLL